MNEPTTRAKICGLMASGALPRHLPLSAPLTAGPTVAGYQLEIGTVSEAHCLVCGEPAPQVSYRYPGGRLIRLHAACEALWQQKRK